MKRQHGAALMIMLMIAGLMGAMFAIQLTGRGASGRAQVAATTLALSEAREALIGFALVNRRLPCPDKTGGVGVGTANDGLEDVTVGTGVCVAQEGNLPWVTLGVSDVDSWGNRIHYRVTPAFSNSPPAVSLALASEGTLRVCQASGCAAVTAIKVPAVVLSYGPNGFGAINAANNALPVPTSADELENTNLNNDFVTRSPSATGAPMGEFDDIVIWLSTNVLIPRMQKAGAL